MTAQAIYDDIATQRQSLWSISGYNGFFTTKEGGERTADSSKVWDGGRRTPAIMVGRADYGNITLTKLYATRIHQAWVRKWQDAVDAGSLFHITEQPLDAHGTKYGKPVVYTGKLVRCTPPGFDAASADAAVIELEFAIGGRA